jgi:hypothetical protein
MLTWKVASESTEAMTAPALALNLSRNSRLIASGGVGLPQAVEQDLGGGADAGDRFPETAVVPQSAGFAAAHMAQVCRSGIRGLHIDGGSVRQIEL